MSSVEAGGVRRRDDHGVRLVQTGHGRVLEPARELVVGAGGEVGLGESLGAVVRTHGGGIGGLGVRRVGWVHGLILQHRRGRGQPGGWEVCPSSTGRNPPVGKSTSVPDVTLPRR